MLLSESQMGLPHFRYLHRRYLPIFRGPQDKLRGSDRITRVGSGRISVGLLQAVIGPFPGHDHTGIPNSLCWKHLCTTVRSVNMRES